MSRRRASEDTDPETMGDPMHAREEFMAWMRKVRNSIGSVHPTTKFTPDITGVIIGSIAGCGKVGTSVSLAGVSSSTVRGWFVKGQEQISAKAKAESEGRKYTGPFDHAEFLTQCQMARAFYESRLSSMLVRAAERGDVQAAIYLHGDARHGGKLSGHRGEDIALTIEVSSKTGVQQLDARLRDMKARKKAIAAKVSDEE